MGKPGEWSFLRRTAQEAERRVISDPSGHEPSAGILPIFWTGSFVFEEGEEPDHINKFPTAPTGANLFELRGGKNLDVSYPLAVDVPTHAMAALLVAARLRKEKQHKTAEHLWVITPEKQIELAYLDETDIN